MANVRTHEMRCQKIRPRLTAYLDQELDVDTRQRVFEHLRHCAVCRGELSAYEETDALLKALPKIPIPRSFRSQVSAAAGMETPRSRRNVVPTRLLERLMGFLGELLVLMERSRPRHGRVLEEFGDFPPMSMGHVYFKLLGGLR